MSELKDILKAIKSKPNKVRKKLLSALEKAASSDNESEPEESFSDLVKRYQKSQAALKKEHSKIKSKPKDITFFSLNFSRYRRRLVGFKKTTPNTQVVGFSSGDTYQEVLTRAAKGLGLQCDTSGLSLICSGGMVCNGPIGEKPWSLGEFVEQNGGCKNRSKRVWGLYIPVGMEDARPTTSDSGYTRTSTRAKKRPASFNPVTESSPKRSPITINSDSSVDSSSVDSSSPITVSMKDVRVEYCPLIRGSLHASVVAVGQIGVWRATQLDFVSDDDSILEEILNEDEFQPEAHQFYITRIFHESKEYLNSSIPIGGSKPKEKVVFRVKDNKFIISHKTQILSHGHALLLVVAPEHGSVEYTWERKNAKNEWIYIDVPIDTCLLYAKCVGVYKCEVARREFTFEVKDDIDMEKNVVKISDDAQIPIKELGFGKIIGQGSFGVVHKGVYKGSDVALKSMKLPPGTDALSLPTEVSMLKNLKHPNIIQLIGYSISDESIIVVTNYVNGSNLDKILFGKHLHDKLTANVAHNIGIKIAEAVLYMHSRNPAVIHQDLKPQNVLVGVEYNKVVICDLGIAKMKKLNDATITSNSKGPGTYPYMAPEMFRPSRRGTAVDIYSLGCLYIELFGRKRIWGKLDAAAIMLKVLGAYQTPPEPPSTTHLAAEYSMLCSGMCNLEASLRPKIVDIVNDMKAIGESATVKANT